MNEPIRVLMTTGWYLPGFKGGGPVNSLANLVSESSTWFRFRVITRDRDVGDDKPYSRISESSWNGVGDAAVFYLRPNWSAAYKLLRILRREKFDVLYVNGLFSWVFSMTPILYAKLTGLPVLVAPRGQLSTGAMGLKARRKRLFIWAFRRLRLEDAIVWHTTSDFEKADIESICNGKPKMVVAENIARRRFPEARVKKQTGFLRIVFLSRLSEKKNLDYALELLKAVESQIRFDIFGPIEDKRFWRRCRKIITELPDNIEVRYRGSADRELVPELLTEYDLFLFPTKGENYGHVIVEAFCSGLPVLISDQTPWRNLEADGLGWDIPLAAPEEFISRIEEMACIDSSGYRDIRTRIGQWARERFCNDDSVFAHRQMFTDMAELMKK